MCTDVILPRLPMLGIDDVPSEFRDAYQRIADSRHGMPTSFATFFNNPPAALALGEFGSHLRFSGGLDDEAVEIIVMQVAAALHDRYMWAHHLELAGRAGITDEELDRIRSSSTPELSTSRRNVLAALAAAVAQARVTDELFGAAAEDLSPADLVEVVLTASYYVMLHHIFLALNIVGDRDTRRPTSEPPFTTDKEVGLR